MFVSLELSGNTTQSISQSLDLPFPGISLQEEFNLDSFDKDIIVIDSANDRIARELFSQSTPVPENPNNHTPYNPQQVIELTDSNSTKENINQNVDISTYSVGFQIADKSSDKLGENKSILNEFDKSIFDITMDDNQQENPSLENLSSKESQYLTILKDSLQENTDMADQLKSNCAIKDPITFTVDLIPESQVIAKTPELETSEMDDTSSSELSKDGIITSTPDHEGEMELDPEYSIKLHLSPSQALKKDQDEMDCKSTAFFTFENDIHMQETQPLHSSNPLIHSQDEDVLLLNSMVEKSKQAYNEYGSDFDCSINSIKELDDQSDCESEVLESKIPEGISKNKSVLQVSNLMNIDQNDIAQSSPMEINLSKEEIDSLNNDLITISKDALPNGNQIRLGRIPENERSDSFKSGQNDDISKENINPSLSGQNDDISKENINPFLSGSQELTSNAMEEDVITDFKSRTRKVTESDRDIQFGNSCSLCEAILAKKYKINENEYYCYKCYNQRKITRSVMQPKEKYKTPRKFMSSPIRQKPDTESSTEPDNSADEDYQPTQKTLKQKKRKQANIKSSKKVKLEKENINSRLFKGYGFILSYSTNPTDKKNDEIYKWLNDKEYVLKQVKTSGGTVISSISTYFQGRTQINKTPPFILLIASRPLRTKKYLMALGNIY
ncbi:hypothetical protein HK103_005294 [Boothiomyces macroporosus]|uniref:BRCT domain-containing protein n=1 Tax=Boothiomyces macroporosus TaxID=261099 RepID=A0AAD5Y2T1_9FUNG|nr:hypothetical protein HK103_005294 [Boothiomyces macroporosus]